MRRAALASLAFVFAFLEVEILEYFRIFYIKPDLLLILAIFTLLNARGMWPLIFVLFCGLLKDSLSFAAFGLNTFSFCCIAILIDVISRHLYFEQDMGFFFFVVIGSLFNSLVNYLYFFHQIIFPSFLRISFLSTIYTALIAVLLSRFLRRFIVVSP